MESRGEEIVITKEDFKLAYPELYMEIWEEGRKAGLESGKKPELVDKERRRGELIREYQKEHLGSSLKDAVLAVGKAHPELFR